MSFLLSTYVINIAILVPVAIPTLLNMWPVDDRKFAESEGWRSIVGSFWLAVLIGSCIGLYRPEKMVPLLLLQVIYKTSFLVVYVFPRMLSGRWRQIPWGITISFLCIVLYYPAVIPWDYLLID